MNIRLATAADIPAYFDHMQRHFAESGRDGDLIFHPIEDYATWNRDEHIAKMIGELETPLDRPGWVRLWICEASGNIVADSLIRSATLLTARHRCQFAIGVERIARRQGLGRRLSIQAISWAKMQPGLEWIDLWASAKNEPALALYRSLGFQVIGTVRDQFRLQGQSVDDTHMTLEIRP
jgi:ribosomal protein S18 acetylase RimI-like enzyme